MVSHDDDDDDDDDDYDDDDDDDDIIGKEFTLQYDLHKNKTQIILIRIIVHLI